MLLATLLCLSDVMAWNYSRVYQVGPSQVGGSKATHWQQGKSAKKPTQFATGAVPACRAFQLQTLQIPSICRVEKSYYIPRHKECLKKDSVATTNNTSNVFKGERQPKRWRREKRTTPMMILLTSLNWSEEEQLEVPVISVRKRPKKRNLDLGYVGQGRPSIVF